MVNESRIMDAMKTTNANQHNVVSCNGCSLGFIVCINDYAHCHQSITTGL